jgi:pimeloyl-ACP methyl ester carboxylesterase
MTTFALMHGGQHGGWCWDLVVDELAARGHRAVAPDMPIGDDAAGAREWAASVAEALGDDGDDVVAVAHSMGGMALPVLAGLRPLRRMVFLGAVVPMPGMSFVEYLGTPEGCLAVTMPMGPDQEPDELGRGACSWATARRYFYPDVPESLARSAWERLRANALTVFVEPFPLDAWPDVPSTTLVLTEDTAVSPDWQRLVSRGRLGSDLVELPGSHSPFLTRPGELAEALVRIAQTTATTPHTGAPAADRARGRTTP